MKNIAVILMATLVITNLSHAQEGAANQQDPMAALGMLFGAGATNPVVHHSQLKALLPAEFAGMKRTNSEAGKQAAMGMNISYAEAEYSNDDASLRAKISDISAMGEFMKMAQYAWMNSEMERETDEGYERTTNIDGFSAMEKYDTSNKSGDLQIMVDGRFMVELSGSGVEMQSVKDLAAAINLKKLQALKPEPPAAK